MTQQHPITPPSDLLKLWRDQFYSSNKDFVEFLIEAAQWGADQELEACLNWLTDRERFPVGHEAIEELKEDRRPKPPSLKEQALDELDRIPTHDSEGRSLGVDVSILRRALEQLDD